PDLSQGVDVRNAPKGAEAVSQKPTADQVLRSILVRMPPQFFGSAGGQQLLTAAQLANGVYAFGDPMEDVEDWTRGPDADLGGIEGERIRIAGLLRGLNSVVRVGTARAGKIPPIG